MKLRPQSPFIYTYTYRHIYTYTYRHIYRYTYKHIVYVHIYQGAKSIVFFCLCVCVHVHFRWGTHLYMLLFLSVCLFVCCTLYLRNCALYHYMIIISGAHILNDSISRLFFHFIKNFNFLGPQGCKMAKNSQKSKIEITSITCHISEPVQHKAYDHGFWYTFVK